MNNRSDYEIMAPVGSYESLMAAINAGADSVYFGIEGLNMRSKSANNFTTEDLFKIAGICREHGVKSYLTVNTIIYDDDLELMRKIIDSAKEAEVSAIIAADVAPMLYARQVGVEVHLSTQLNITNVEALRFYAQFADVVVLARELNMDQVSKIHEAIINEPIVGPAGKPIRIEMFAHGALCMAVSGKCYLSLHSHNSSANRGACKQNCRKKYTVIDQESGFEIELDNEYMMSPKDLCTLDFLDQVIDTGAKVLKIEGRGRAPEYVATVIRTYREAIDAYYAGTYTKEKVAVWMEALATVYNRGFWGGYYLGQKLGEWSGAPGSQATQKKVYIGKAMHFFPKTSISEFKIEAFDIKRGDKLLITGPTTGVQELVLEDMYVNDVLADNAKKGDSCTFFTDFRTRPSDKLYKIVKA